MSIPLPQDLDERTRAPLPPMFFSTFMYAACKVTDLTAAELLAREQRDLDASVWPGFRVLGQAIRLASCIVHVDGSTYITRARCVAAGGFLRGRGADCDVWLTCDDDVYADREVIRSLVTACRETRGLVALPYLNRDGQSMTFRKVSGPTLEVGGALLRTVDRVGMGLVAMHREFLTTLDYLVPHFENDYPALFLEGVTDVDKDTGVGIWTGEDFWLCMLAEREGLPMHVLLDAEGEHAGRRAKLDTEGNILVAGEAQRDQLQKGLLSRRM